MRLCFGWSVSRSSNWPHRHLIAVGEIDLLQFGQWVKTVEGT